MRQGRAHTAHCHIHTMLQEEMAAANIDMASRDFCAHILIKLNQCRCAAGAAHVRVWTLATVVGSTGACVS